jgi:hypothetical protein
MQHRGYPLLLGFVLMGGNTYIFADNCSASPSDVACPHAGDAGDCPRKRPRGDEDTYDDMGLGGNDDHRRRPRKKGKGKMAVNGVLEAAGNTSRAHHKPAARTRTKGDKSKTAERGAGRLAALNVQGVYHQSLPGPSVQQVLRLLRLDSRRGLRGVWKDNVAPQ